MRELTYRNTEVVKISGRVAGLSGAWYDLRMFVYEEKNSRRLWVSTDCGNPQDLTGRTLYEAEVFCGSRLRAE